MMSVCLSPVMDIRVSPHRDIVAFKELLDSWLTEAGPGCSMRFICVSSNKHDIALISTDHVAR